MVDGLVKRREAEMAPTLLEEEAPLPPIDIRIGEVETVLEKGLGASSGNGSCWIPRFAWVRPCGEGIRYRKA